MHGKYISLMGNMVYMGNMTQSFIVQIKDEKQRRIIIDKEAWKGEQLEKGDYIEVIIKKIKSKSSA
jgi:hypothetical protein